MTFGTYSITSRTQNHENMDENAWLDGLFNVYSINLLAKYHFQMLILNFQYPNKAI